MCQCEALARLPKLPYFLILLFLSLALYQPASAYVYFTSCMSSLITFNHTYLKCIFIFTYILYAGKPSAGRLRLGRQWDGESVLPLTLTEQMDQKKAASKSVSAISRRTYKGLTGEDLQELEDFLRELGSVSVQASHLQSLHRYNRCKVMR